jgi:hypothetical protein
MVSCGEEMVDEMRANESRTTSDQNGHYLKLRPEQNHVNFVYPVAGVFISGRFGGGQF